MMMWRAALLSEMPRMRLLVLLCLPVQVRTISNGSVAGFAHQRILRHHGLCFSIIKEQEMSFLMGAARTSLCLYM